MMRDIFWGVLMSIQKSLLPFFLIELKGMCGMKRIKKKGSPLLTLISCIYFSSRPIHPPLSFSSHFNLS